MKAAVLYELGRPLVIEELEVPELRRGQVLVKVQYSGVCHSQLMEARGFRGQDRFLPHLLGHEGVGLVEKIGPEVKKVKVGDRVVLGWIKGSGIEAGGTQYRSKNGTMINSGGVTTFSEVTVVSENRLVTIPAAIPDQVAVLFGCAVPTGAGIVLNELKPRAGATMAVFGLGGIGLSALMAAPLFNLKKVIALDVEPSKLELAKKFGATDVINSANVDAVKAIKELTNGEGVDYAVEASGLARVIEAAFASVKLKGGKTVFASHPKHGDKISLDPFELICGKTIQGSWGGGCDPDRDLPQFYDMYLNGRLPLNELLSKPYALEQINEALDALENRKVARATLKIGAV